MAEGEEGFHPDPSVEDAGRRPSLSGPRAAWLVYWLSQRSLEELMECFEADRRFSEWVRSISGRD